MYAGRTHTLPFIRDYAEARKWWNEHPKPPRSKKWDDYQRPLQGTAFKHYRLESMFPEQFIDVVLYQTTMARYFAPDADGNERRLYMGHGTITSRNFMGNVLNLSIYCNTVETTDGRTVVAPIYQRDFLRVDGAPFSADFLFTPDNKLIVEKSSHTRHWRKVSTADDRAERAGIRELFKPYLDIAMFRMQAYEANVTLNHRIGRPFGELGDGYTHQKAINNMRKALERNEEPTQDDINLFFDLGQHVFDGIASKRGYAQDDFTLDSWYSQHAKRPLSPLSDLDRPVTADDLRKSLTDRIVKLTDANTPSGWEEIPQFVVESEYPRSNVYARPNTPK